MVTLIVLFVWIVASVGAGLIVGRSISLREARDQLPSVDTVPPAPEVTLRPVGAPLAAPVPAPL